jgi:hypothetical protein
MINIKLFNKQGVYIACHDYRDNNPPHFIVHHKFTSRFFHGPYTILKFLNLDKSSQLYYEVKEFLEPFLTPSKPAQVVQM